MNQFNLGPQAQQLAREKQMQAQVMHEFRRDVIDHFLSLCRDNRAWTDSDTVIHDLFKAAYGDAKFVYERFGVKIALQEEKDGPVDN